MVKGDVSIDGLGISDADKGRLIESTNVVFHCAANVRFDQAIEGLISRIFFVPIDSFSFNLLSKLTFRRCQYEYIGN